MLYDNIKILCDKNNISIPQLERELNFGAGTIYKWQIVSPSVDNLQKVADYFKVTIDSLVPKKIVDRKRGLTHGPSNIN